ncbi:hypothetical protein ABW20_dc0101478 [Dactylellina cionopaga]|nr:hypothetical protein ABW20_dc0101478 [Dactylellina cionopaga]
MKSSLRCSRIRLPQPQQLFAAGALTAAPVVWSARRTIADKLSSIAQSIYSWLPSAAPPPHHLLHLDQPITYTTALSTASDTPTSHPTESEGRSSLPLFPSSFPTTIMDDLLITVYPYAKIAAAHLTTALSHFLKVIYPLLNHLYNTNPTVVSVILLASSAYLLIRIVTAVTNFIWAVTRNIFQFFFVVGVILACVNYYKKRAAGRLTDDGNVLEGFDWDATYKDFQGVWGFVQNMGGVVMDLLESGSHLEDGNTWNSGRRKTVGKKGDGMFAEPTQKQKWR